MRYRWPTLTALVLQVMALGCGPVQEKTTAAQDVSSRCLPIVITIGDESLTITNNDTRPWTDFRVTVNETDDSLGFVTTVPNIGNGTAKTIPFGDLVRNDGLRFDPKNYKVLHVAARSNEGMWSGVRCDPEERKRLMDRLEKMASGK